MKKTFIAAAVVAASALIPAQAQQGAFGAALQRPSGGLGEGIRMSYSNIIKELAPTGVDLLLIVPAVLRGQPVGPNIRQIVLPLPGPAFLNLPLVNVPGTISVNVRGGGPVVVTIGTGGR